MCEVSWDHAIPHQIACCFFFYALGLIVLESSNKDTSTKLQGCFLSIGETIPTSNGKVDSVSDNQPPAQATFAETAASIRPTRRKAYPLVLVFVPPETVVSATLARQPQACLTRCLASPSRESRVLQSHTTSHWKGAKCMLALESWRYYCMYQKKTRKCTRSIRGRLAVASTVQAQLRHS